MIVVMAYHFRFYSPHEGQKKPFFLFYSFHHVHYPHYSGEQFRNSSKRGTFGDALVSPYIIGLLDTKVYVAERSMVCS